MTGATGENTAKHSSGRLISADAVVDEISRSVRTSPSSGPTTVIEARRLAAMRRMPAITSPRRIIGIALGADATFSVSEMTLAIGVPF